MKGKKVIENKKNFEEQWFNWSIFILTFIVLGAMLTVQMFILKDYVQYKDISLKHILGIIFYWIASALAFTFVTLFQINKRYKKPLEQFAFATKQVANGDFSVFVPPKNPPSKQDFLDKIFVNFNKMVEELGSIETLKTDFFSNVSHEIKTPIATMQGYAEMLLQDDIDDKTRKDYAENIVVSSKKLSSLISNILKLNRLEKSTIYDKPKPYDLCAQLCECALSFEEIWLKKNIAFTAEMEDRVFINAEKHLMELVWNNLLSNAVKFTNANGQITLTQTSDAESVYVTISDDGVGMDSTTKYHIFDKFYQGDTSHATEGNGLGLALAMRVIDISGFSITVKSEPQIGSSFTIYMQKSKKMEED